MWGGTRFSDNDPTVIIGRPRLAATGQSRTAANFFSKAILARVGVHESAPNSETCETLFMKSVGVCIKLTWAD